MDNTQNDRLELLTRSVHALLQWAESHPLTQWEQAGILSALRLEIEDARENDALHDLAASASVPGR